MSEVLEAKDNHLEFNSTPVSIIIPVYNNSNLTKQCIDSILKFHLNNHYEIIVVDNASTDKTEALLENYTAQYQNIKYYRSESNSGFANACNLGASKANGEVLVFLNNDTISLDNWIDAGLATLKQDFEIGIVGAKLLYEDLTIQHCGIVFERRKEHYLPLWPTHIFRGKSSDYLPANETKEYDAVTGACLFIRKDLFVSVEGFDEKYGMYFEDIDLCFKVKSLNKKIFYEPKCSLIHLEGKSTSNQQSIDELNIESSKRFYNKWRKKINQMSEREIDNTVYWLSPIFNPSGYASEAIGFALGLDDHLDLVIRHQNKFLSSDFINNLPAHWRETLFRLHVLDPDEWYKEIDFSNNPIVVQHQPANAFYKIPGTYCIGRTMYETDRLPKDWVEKCNMMDEVWVPSRFNKETFAKYGVDNKKIFVVPGSIDTEVFDPDSVEPLDLPNKASFNFLSIFEWTNRKGWDILLRAYFESFSINDDICLYLRTYLLSNYDLDTKTEIQKKIDDLIKRFNYKKENLPRLELLTNQLPFKQMVQLYKSVDAFVLSSRGEGWGRPYMEAMAFGLPVIGTNWSGNTEFMNKDNSYLLDINRLVTIRDNEIQSYLGHQWAEPSKDQLISLFREIFSNPQKAKDLGTRAKKEVTEKFSLEAVAQIAMQRLKCIASDKSNFLRKSNEIKITWEGDQFVYHSLALINRELCKRVASNNYDLALQTPHKNIFDQQLINSNSSLVKLANKINNLNDIHVRHEWPPNLQAPKTGRWVIIQPYEFGTLPQEWVHVFSEQVDEMWVPSNYVKQIYIDSGIPEDRVFVVPNGFDPAVFNYKISPFKIKTKKKFKFLFVGGTIYRKGIDILLKSYFSTFKKSDDVCLVIKDMGTDTFYKGQTIKEKLMEYTNQKDSPEVEYITNLLNEKQLSGLYRACDVLVHPYRGEGFGLPILEAMACSLPVIVTKGGASDDFCNDDNSIKIESVKTYLQTNKIGDDETVDIPWLLEPDLEMLSQKMLFAFQNQNEIKEIGRRAEADVKDKWTWDKTFEIVRSRINVLMEKPIFRLLEKSIVDTNEIIDQQILKSISEAYSIYNSGDCITTLKKTKLLFDKIDSNIFSQDNNILLCSVFNLTGLASFGIGNLKVAKQSFENALKINPTSSEACFGLGQVFYQAEMFEESKTMLEWAVKNNPDNQTAIEALKSVNQILSLPEIHNSLFENAVVQIEAES